MRRCETLPARQETQISARDPITQNQTPLKPPSELPQDNNAIHTRHILTSDTKDSNDKHTHTPSDTRHNGQTVQIAADRRQYAEQKPRRHEGPQGKDKHKRNKNARETPPKSEDNTFRASKGPHGAAGEILKSKRPPLTFPYSSRAIAR